MSYERKARLFCFSALGRGPVQRPKRRAQNGETKTRRERFGGVFVRVCRPIKAIDFGARRPSKSYNRFAIDTTRRSETVSSGRNVGLWLGRIRPPEERKSYGSFWPASRGSLVRVDERILRARESIGDVRKYSFRRIRK